MLAAHSASLLDAAATRRDRDLDGSSGPKASAAPKKRQRRRVEPGKWQIANVIGQGSFGAIYLGMNQVTGELIAVKELPIRKARDVAELRQ